VKRACDDHGASIAAAGAPDLENLAVCRLATWGFARISAP
jgi:hypothetical protein